MFFHKKVRGGKKWRKQMNTIKVLVWKKGKSRIVRDLKMKDRA